MRTAEYAFLAFAVALTVGIAAYVVVAPIANSIADSGNTFNVSAIQ